MATTTPNFGWSVPTSTDLVKDGATAIETLGDAIDASMADLKGGTTGQLLAKNSGTDMDFTWTAAGLSASIVDAKGDLIAATAADTVTRLPVGTNGQLLVADSTAATGLAWTTISTTPTMYEERFTASGTWTVPTGVTQVWVTMIGGGGGGAGTGSYLGEAGKHGAVTDQMLAVTAGASVSYTIGAGGAGGAAGGNNGDVGSATSFGALSAAGGYFGAAALFALSGLARGKQAEATPINGGVTNAVSSDAVGTAGTANTGGGGSSSRSNTGGSYAGGAGGSGFIFIRYVK